MKTVVSDHPLFAADEVRYIGQPLFLVAGPDRQTIAGIISNIRVEYREEKAVLSLEEAERDTAPLTEYRYAKGDADGILHNAQRIIEDRIGTGYQEHVYLEPQGVAAEFRDGTLVVYGSMQCPFYVKNALVESMAMPEEKVRVVQTVTGGAFGGKEEFPSLMACQAAVAAKKTGKPVKMIYDREEDILASTKRHPAEMRYKAALDGDGRVIALDIDVLLNAGAYSGLSPVVLQRALFSATGVYNIPHLKVRGRNLMTNTVPSGAFRGFGAPQTIFGIEMLFHNIALERGADPLEYKMRHVLKQHDSTCTGGSIHEEVKVPEMVQKAIRMSRYREKRRSRTPYRGIGASLFLHGCGFTGRGEADIRGKITLCRKGKNIIIKVSSVEMGQGAETALRKIVARTMDLPLERVSLEKIDTGRVPDSGPTVASRTTMIVGGLLRESAEEMLARRDEKGDIEISRRYRHPAYLHWDDENFRGDAYPVYSWGVNIAEVEIDPLTYEVKVQKVHAVYDVGVPIDERALRGQMQGGIVQGTGWATIENMRTGGGRLIQANLTDYKAPTVMDVPEIDCAFVRNPYPYGPFGAKCAGELPMTGAPPAVAAAVSDALGKKVHRIPLTPELLMERVHED
jgi:CO/xanthine dehydrogenase Mo-binding subunit